jgi:hypothetical protein
VCDCIHRKVKQGVVCQFGRIDQELVLKSIYIVMCLRDMINRAVSSKRQTHLEMLECNCPSRRASSINVQIFQLDILKEQAVSCMRLTDMVTQTNLSKLAVFHTRRT